MKIRFTFLFHFVLCFLFLNNSTAFAANTAGSNKYSLSRQLNSFVVVSANEKGLELTRRERLGPPVAAWLWAVANEAASLNLSQSPQPEITYMVAYSRILSLFAPNQQRGLENEFSKFQNSAQEKEALQLGVDAAQKVWAFHLPKYKSFSQSLPEPWPTQNNDGVWRPTPPQMSQPVLPYWGKGSLWSHGKNKTYTGDLHFPALNSPAFLKNMQMTYQLGGKNSKVRTQVQSQIAIFWIGGPGTVTPPGLWMQIANQRILEDKVDFQTATKIMHALSCALSDAGTLAWDTKYAVPVWRPITSIQEMLEVNWQPLIDTPPFPSFVNGHSTFSSAGATILEALLPLQGRMLSVQSEDLKGVTRRFGSYRAAADEAGWSRIFGGIHYEADHEAGKVLGFRSACAVLRNDLNRLCKPL